MKRDSIMQEVLKDICAVKVLEADPTCDFGRRHAAHRILADSAEELRARVAYVVAILRAGEQYDA